MMPALAAVAIEFVQATGDLGRTSEYPAAAYPIHWSPTVSSEGRAMDQRLGSVRRALTVGKVIAPVLGSGTAVQLAAVVPSTWNGFALALFPASRTMSRDERRAFDANAWSDLEPLEFVDD